MKRASAVTSLLLLVVIVAGTAQTQSPGVHPVSGRRYAGVMSYEGAPWLDREERDIEEEPDRAVNAIGIEAGQTVADLGAGSGYMTVRMAARVGPAGKVYATDIQPQMLELLRRRLARDNITNVELVLGAVDDPKLPPSSLDLILMVDVYHEFSQPQKMLRGMRAALKPGGRLVLLEYRKEDPDVPIRYEHKMSVAEARQELEAEGFRFVRVNGILPRQHILIFEKPGS
jgi:ubiquinone/menaquinone biosynthesis C-methylase UbiE